MSDMTPDNINNLITQMHALAGVDSFDDEKDRLAIEAIKLADRLIWSAGTLLDSSATAAFNAADTGYVGDGGDYNDRGNIREKWRDVARKISADCHRILMLAPPELSR